MDENCRRASWFITVEDLETIDKVTMLSENTLFFIQMFHIKYILSFEGTVLFLWEYNLYCIEWYCFVKEKENESNISLFNANIGTERSIFFLSDCRAMYNDKTGDFK